MRYIITNFAYGFGPFLRTAELALKVSDLLKAKTGEQSGVIIPWVYGEKQKAIIEEQFSELIKNQPELLVLDKNLGQYLDSVFYGKKSYSEALEYLVDNGQKLQQEIKEYLNGGLVVETLSGQKQKINQQDIILEINRNARVDFGFEFSYQATFAYASEILQHALADKIGQAKENVINLAINWFSQIENRQRLNLIAEPATFFYLGQSRPKLYPTEERTPPNCSLPKPIETKIDKGIYVTVTGIPGLDKLFAEAKKIGLKIYTNQPEIITESMKMSPKILGNKNILLHFARSGWGSIWLSQLTDTPFIAPAYQNEDDPEIYFNNICLGKIGLGKIYQGQSLAELLGFKAEYQASVDKVNQYLLEQYKTLDGLEYAAEKIINNYLNVSR